MQRPRLTATCLALLSMFALNSVGAVARPVPIAASNGTAAAPAARLALLRKRVRHVVIIVQENRTVDNLFNGYPGADTVTIDPYTGTPLQSRSLADPCDPDHLHASFVADFAGGAMNGFQTSPCSAYSFVPSSELSYYWGLAASNVLADETFQSNQGPSYPAHQYLYAGRSCSYPTDLLCISENDVVGNGLPLDPHTYCGKPAQVPEMDMTSQYPGNESAAGPSCKNYGRTIISEATAAGLSWRYYSKDLTGYWSGPTSDANCFAPHGSVNPCQRNIIPNPAKVLTDIAAHKLAQIVFVTPLTQNSDHPGDNTSATSGELWVAGIIGAIQSDSFYASGTTVLLTWDDWGGWYDHVPPPIAPWTGDPYEYGFRVPLIVVSQHLKAPGSVDHTVRNVYGSMLRYVETTFRLASLNQVDAPGLTDDLTELFQ